MFIKLSNAYTILSDENERKDYDYYLDHPEDALYNKFRYYRYSYGPKTDLRYVLLGIVNNLII